MNRPLSKTPRWDLLGLAGGLALGVADWLVFDLLGVDMRLAGRDISVLLGLFFAGTYAFLGLVMGRLAMARGRARGAAETIGRQLAELALSRRAAAQAEKLAALGRVAAGIAHEVRNPLGVIRASASMVRDELAPGGDTERACGFIIDEIDRLDRLIDSLLSFARPGEPRFGELSLPDVVERAVRLAADETRRRGIAVRTAFAPHLPALVADADLLAQVVLNLLVNAAEAIGEGGDVLIDVAGTDLAQHIDVADSGPGLADADPELVFEPFYTTKAGGTGLGLAVTARLIERHGGRISVRSGEGLGPAGRGARFRVELPTQGAVPPEATA